ncbi:MAG: HEAT repeat domain-containing protein [Candidatus Didemnitutus sp.]|nr:HEAT repeat domain-containing protein [Candidatus Didemnitutus sp.]
MPTPACLSIFLSRLLIASCLVIAPSVGARDTATLIDLLQSENVEMRRAATNQLGEHGPDAVAAQPQLITALGDEDVQVRANAAWALGKIQGQSDLAAHALIAAFADADWTVRHNASLSIIWRGPSMLPMLDESLVAPNPLVRLYAAYARLQIAPQDPARVIPTLTALLSAEQTEVRHTSAQILGGIGPAAAATIPQLITLLEDNIPVVRQQAIMALGAMGKAARRAIPQLIALVGPDQTSATRIAAATTLAAINLDFEQWIPAVLTMFQPNRSESVQAGAVAALVNVGAPAVPYLIDVLGEADVGVLLFATQALTQIGKASALATPRLIAQLHHDNWQIRLATIEALGAIGQDSESVMQALQSAKEDSEEVVQLSATLALERLTKGPAGP